MTAKRLDSAINEFIMKSNAAYYEENWTERKEQKEYYRFLSKTIF